MKNFKVTKTGEVGQPRKVKFEYEKNGFKDNTPLVISRLLTNTVNETGYGIMSFSQLKCNFTRQNDDDRCDVIVEFPFEIDLKKSAKSIKEQLIARAEIVNTAFASNYPTINESSEDDEEIEEMQDEFVLFCQDKFGLKAEILTKWYKTNPDFNMFEKHNHHLTEEDMIECQAAVELSKNGGVPLFRVKVDRKINWVIFTHNVVVVMNEKTPLKVLPYESAPFWALKLADNGEYAFVNIEKDTLLWYISM